MPLLRRTFFRWLPLAGLATAMCLLIYLAYQQAGRHAANDPQIQLARDAAYAIEAGRPVETVVPATLIDLQRSPAPFLEVLDESGAVLATSGRLHGEPRAVPAGVLDVVRRQGEERITWQPEPGVRMATVVVRTAGQRAGFVVAGRSLESTEERASQFQSLVLIAWALTLAGLLVLVGVSEYGVRS